MITKIQSFTDVITNSSSTVFVMHSLDSDYYNMLENTDGCVSVEKIDMEWLIRNPEEVEMVCELLNVNPRDITTRESFNHYEYWNTPDRETWEAFLEMHKEQIEKTFKDLYWVDIEDHFVDAWEVTEQAVNDSVWHDYRH